MGVERVHSLMTVYMMDMGVERVHSLMTVYMTNMGQRECMP